MLNNEFPPLGGGTGVVNYHLLTEMSAYREIWIDLVTSSRSCGDYEIEQFADRITIHKVPVDNKNIHRSSSRELMRYGWRGLQHSLQLVKQKQFHMSFALASVPAGAISYALQTVAGLPYLVSLQGLDVPGFGTRYQYLYPVIKPLLRRIWSAAGAVTANSAGLRKLAHQTLPTLNISLVYNGVDTNFFHPSETARGGFEIGILCVGRLIERKGQHHLLKAFHNLKSMLSQPLRLILAGAGDAEESLRLLAAELGVADTVSFLGPVPRADVPALYHQADVFTLPSQNEGMSIALLEAMASGLPVVTTTAGGTSELVCDGVNGYIVPWADVPALTEALALLARNADIRQRMGHENRRIAGEFSWSHITQGYLALCENIIYRSQSPTAHSRFRSPTSHD